MTTATARGDANTMIDEELILELPSPQTHGCFRLLLFVICLVAMFGAFALEVEGVLKVAGVLFILWSCLFGVGLAVYPSVALSIRSPHACLVNCVAVCMSFSGYDVNATGLAEELQLNRSGRGTRIPDLFRFLTNRSIVVRASQCHDIEDLRQALEVNKVPLVGIIRKPILHSRYPWKLIFPPFALLSTGSPWTQYPKLSHAVVVHGVARETVCVYDPAYGTLHRLTWDQFQSWIVPNALFLDGSLLAILPNDQPTIPAWSSINSDLNGGDRDSTF